MIRVYGSYLVIYVSESKPEMVFLQYLYRDGVHELNELITVQTPDWDKLIDFQITEDRIWALANMCEGETIACFMDFKKIKEGASDEAGMIERWEFVQSAEVTEPPNVKSLVAEIFWRNHFAVSTIQKALVGIVGPSIPKKNDMDALEELALTRIVNDDQDTAWRRFHEYCLQNHSNANKSLGLISSPDESLICVARRSNPSFICPVFSNFEYDQNSLFRGIEISVGTREILQKLNQLSNHILQEDHCLFFEEKLIESPSEILSVIQDFANIIISCKGDDIPSFDDFKKTSFLAGISEISEQLDLTARSQEFCSQILNDSSKNIKSDRNPLASNLGIMITFEVFRRLVRARMELARDTLIYISILGRHAETDRSISSLCDKIYTSGLVKKLLDSLRSYSILTWIADSPIKVSASEASIDLIQFVSRHFLFFKESKRGNQGLRGSVENVLHRNLFMSFLMESESNFQWPVSHVNDQQSISSSHYLTEIALNLCKLLWPMSGYICFEEFMFTQHLDEHLGKYIGLTQDWVECSPYDRHFVNAANCMLQKRACQAVDIFNKLWVGVQPTNLLGRIMELTPDDDIENIATNSKLINLYYDKLIHMFQVHNNKQCLVDLINNCMSLLEEQCDGEQTQMMNSLRAKLFQFHLELEDPDEAYHVMVLTTDHSLRVNCLRRFIISHCEREQWINLLSYPFIDIKDDFIDILIQKAESLDLSVLDSKDFYKTSYYDLLFATYVMDDDFNRAAEVMYNYSQRLAQEVPGITSIRKQADCLLIALNSLRSIPEKDRYLEFGNHTVNNHGRTSILKRSYDCESNASSHDVCDYATPASNENSIVRCQDIEKKYELTRARLRLLERDQTTNVIALSPLKPEETINQLVASSLFSNAMDLALLFKSDMEPILSGLAAKYILVMKLTSVDLEVYQDIERSLSDLFTNSYSNIDTYNYVANSSSPLVDRLWRLIDYYLNTYDGVSHKYQLNDTTTTPAATTVLMRVVATKLLSAGYDVPASLKRLYMIRNAPELLKLMIKYDKLADASELAIEMIDRTLEPVSCLSLVTQVNKSERPPIYLPTHLIILLITYLEEDATDTAKLKLASCLSDRLNKFRNFVKSN